MRINERKKKVSKHAHCLETCGYLFNDKNKLFKYILFKNILLNLNKRKKKSKNRVEDLKKKYFRLKRDYL